MIDQSKKVSAIVSYNSTKVRVLVNIKSKVNLCSILTQNSFNILQNTGGEQNLNIKNIALILVPYQLISNSICPPENKTIGKSSTLFVLILITTEL